MCTYLILGGAGRQAKAIAWYLWENTTSKIVLGDIQDCKLPGTTAETITAPADSIIATFKSSKDDKYDIEDTIIISCLRPETTAGLIRSLTLGPGPRGFLDLGGDEGIPKKIRNYLYPPKFPAVLECGIAPGMPACIAGEAIKQKVRNVKIYCGGLPNCIAKHDYLRSFNTEGLYAELTGAAEILQGGKVCYLPTMMGDTNLLLDDDFYGARITSGGLGDTCSHLEGELDTLEYYTLRSRTHWQFMKDYILWRTKEDAIETMDKVFDTVNKDRPDKILMYVAFDGQPTYSWSWYHNGTNSAMEQATGYTAAAVATMIEDGLVPNRLTGMFELDLEEVITRARKMPNQFMETK